MIKLKRIYEEPTKNDGFRILVDRLWPRGVSKKRAKLNLWLKDIAPTGSLRKWFAHDPKKWTLFQKKYMDELQANKESIEQIKKLIKIRKNITLLYAAKDQEHNEAIVIKDFLEM
jgi:uncharacterized protein YeaO (DUF488 family)